MDVKQEALQGRFFQDHVDSRRIESGWFYQAREGHRGPFASREAAERDLADLIAANPLRRREINAD